MRVLFFSFWVFLFPINIIIVLVSIFLDDKMFSIFRFLRRIWILYTLLTMFGFLMNHRRSELLFPLFWQAMQIIRQISIFRIFKLFNMQSIFNIELFIHFRYLKFSEFRGGKSQLVLDVVLYLNLIQQRNYITWIYSYAIFYIVALIVFRGKFSSLTVKWSKNSFLL